MRDCEKCQRGVRCSFNMQCMTCCARWLLQQDKRTRGEWLESYRKSKGEDQYQELVAIGLALKLKEDGE